ncbi:MAG TPA: hypothetical protein VFR03_16590 [Thermoanaerobaculia bacterium]|nr:hypothetical protein [Thermoanaerobaculia bacterium]
MTLTLSAALLCAAAATAQPDIAGPADEAAELTGTAGLIKTRPTCVPPKYTPDALNYLQGPEPIQQANGDVTLLVGTGRCCNMHHWEGLFSLNYPAAGRNATPRFRGLWATNDFSRLPGRKEGEIGFPSAMFYGGKWRIGLTTAFLPFHKPDRDRMSRLDLGDLVARATPSQVTNLWIKPIDPKCQAIASCPGQGSGLSPVLTMHPNGDLYVYHTDGNYPACPSGYVRHRVAASMSIVGSNPDGCIRFEGLTGTPDLISDIGRTRDGRMLLLASKLTPRGSFITEWVSEGTASEIGLSWRPSGRQWAAPVHPQAPEWGYFARDGAFLKTSDRTVVEPNVVVAQISDGRSYEEMVDVQLGRWYLYYWADEGAVLPPGFGGPANACAFQGKLESASCTEARGWAWDPMFPKSPVSVEVLVDGVYKATVPANVFRQDQVTAGHGDGRHGFSWPVPASLKDGKRHRITVRFAESDSTDLLAGKPVTINCR